MKKTLLITLLSLSTAGTYLFGQGFNGGFETWGAGFGQPTEPTGWVTANLFAAPILTFPSPNPNPTSAFQATGADLYIGTYSLRLLSVTLAYNPDTANIPGTLGAAVTGMVVTPVPLVISDRIPFTGRPAILAFAAKYAPVVPQDSASLYMELTRWNGTSRDLVMGFYVPISTASAYQNYSLPLSAFYVLPNTIPDSMSVAISSTRILTPTAGSNLHIDNISFSGYVGTEELSQQSGVSVFPSPANESVTIDASGLKAQLSHAEILDVNGKLVGKVDMRNSYSITFNASFLPVGNYTFNLVGTQGIRLADGKFQIVR